MTTLDIFWPVAGAEGGVEDERGLAALVALHRAVVAVEEARAVLGVHDLPGVALAHVTLVRPRHLGV